MADFRHAIDWLAFYPKMVDIEPWDPDPHSRVSEPSPWSADRFASIQGVQIAGDQQIKDGSQRYTVVKVHASHPIRGIMTKLHGNISPISKRLGRPLRLVMGIDRKREADADYLPTTCDTVEYLMRRTENDTSVVLPGLESGRLCGGLPPEGRVLVVRADDKDLSVDDVEAMARFSIHRALLQDVSVFAPRVHEAELEVTWDNYLLTFDRLGLPRPQRSAEEAFVDMRKPDASDDGEELIDVP